MWDSEIKHLAKYCRLNNPKINIIFLCMILRSYQRKYMTVILKKLANYDNTV